ncbi:glycosyltransferase family 4 protein [Bacillus sp. FSL K6-3431]|uniref:glycosyltransferase family 4 protein n=1 Tax=Bacillus sp. FSL K6-3431 TaxID=2921500 RepID=UPI0030F7D4BE
MRVLQIACGVSYTDIYYNLFSALKQKDIDFEVYIPQHKGDSVQNITKSEFPFLFYSNKIIRSYDKLLYFSKIRRMTKDVETNFNLSKISLIHSHSLFSDGAVAYEIFKKYNIPYIVAIRDTDVNQYFRKGIHLRKFAVNILRNASHVIFLSKPYRDKVLNKYIPDKYQNEIMKKSKIIPNGIDNYWLNNKSSSKSRVDNNIRLIYVGQIIKRKNIMKIIEASNLLKDKYNKKVSIVLIGKKKDEKYFKKISRKGSFEYIPYLPKEHLISYYRKSDVFVMPSKTETFGLVYAEAMSQGLPVIYSRGQGFDGQFNEGEIGYSVEAKNKQDIATKIIRILDDVTLIRRNCIERVDKFNWDTIAQDYQNLYYQVLD